MSAAGRTVPRSFIAFTPFGVGLLCALVYFEKDRDIYGWWIGARDSEHQSAYFKLEDYFTRMPARFYAAEGADLYGGWRFDYSAEQSIVQEPLRMDEDVAHELERVQDVFVSEWLFFGDTTDAAEREAYGRMKFPIRDVNIRVEGLNRLSKDEPVWIYRSHDFDTRVLEFLARYWPLDYGSYAEA
jgi:hypothetical protein